jgi:hypothetical protein
MGEKFVENGTPEYCTCGCDAVIDRNAPTFWNGIPIASMRGSAVVADAPEFPQYWAKREGIVGQRIPVVMVNLDGANYGGGISYLDNRDEEGWRKIAYGNGSPRYRHKNVSIEPGSFAPEDAGGDA